MPETGSPKRIKQDRTQRVAMPRNGLLQTSLPSRPIFYLEYATPTIYSPTQPTRGGYGDDCANLAQTKAKRNPSPSKPKVGEKKKGKLAEWRKGGKNGGTFRRKEGKRTNLHKHSQKNTPKSPEHTKTAKTIKNNQKQSNTIKNNQKQSKTI